MGIVSYRDIYRHSLRHSLRYGLKMIQNVAVSSANQTEGLIGLYTQLISGCSSSLIAKVLRDAHDVGIRFRVIVVDGRPKLEGPFPSVCPRSLREASRSVSERNPVEPCESREITLNVGK